MTTPVRDIPILLQQSHLLARLFTPSVQVNNTPCPLDHSSHFHLAPEGAKDIEHRSKLYYSKSGRSEAVRVRRTDVFHRS